MRCPRCNVEAEDMQHLVLNCHWAKEVWDTLKLESGQVMVSLQSNSWRDFLMRMWKSGKSGNVEQWKRLCFILYTKWELWKQRNAWGFKGESCLTLVLCRHVREQVMREWR